MLTPMVIDKTNPYGILYKGYLFGASGCTPATALTRTAPKSFINNYTIFGTTKLPNIPDYNTETYLYKYIQKTPDTPYKLVIVSKQLYLPNESTTNNGIFQGEIFLNSSWVLAENSEMVTAFKDTYSGINTTSWTAVTTDEELSTINLSNILWSNFNIVYEDQTIYFEGISEIPLTNKAIIEWDGVPFSEPFNDIYYRLSSIYIKDLTIQPFYILNTDNILTIEYCTLKEEATGKIQILNSDEQIVGYIITTTDYDCIPGTYVAKFSETQFIQLFAFPITNFDLVEETKNAQVALIKGEDINSYLYKILTITHDELKWGGSVAWHVPGDYDNTEPQLGSYYIILQATTPGTYCVIIPQAESNTDDSLLNGIQLSLEAPSAGIYMFESPWEFTENTMLLGIRDYSRGPMENSPLNLTSSAYYKQLPATGGEYTEDGIYVQKIPITSFSGDPDKATKSGLKMYGKCPPGATSVHFSAYNETIDKNSLEKFIIHSCNDIQDDGLFWVEIDEYLMYADTQENNEYALGSGEASANIVLLDDDYILCDNGYKYCITHKTSGSSSNRTYLDSGFRVIGSYNYGTGLIDQSPSGYVATNNTVSYKTYSTNSNNTSVTWTNKWSYTHDTQINAITNDSDGIYTGHTDGSIKKLTSTSSAATFKWTAQPHSAIVNDIAISDNIYSTSEDCTTHSISEYATSKWTYTHSSAGRALAIMTINEMKYIIVGLSNGNIDILNDSGELIRSFSTGLSTINCLYINKGFKNIFAGGDSSNIVSFNIFGQILFNLNTNLESIEHLAVLSYHPTLTKNQNFVLMASYQNKIQCYELKAINPTKEDEYCGVIWCEAPAGGKFFGGATVQVYCLSGDTLITLADYTTKRLDNLTLNDIILSYDGTPTKITGIDRGIFNNQHILYYFDNDTIINETYEHRFFNIEQDGYIKLKDWNIGEHAKAVDGTTTALISKEIINEPAEMFGLYTESGCYWANGLLSGAAAKEILTGNKLKKFFNSFPQKVIQHLFGKVGWFD